MLHLLMKSRQQHQRAIILGVGSAEYDLYCRLESGDKYRVLFFINDDPWSHRTKIGNAELRSPSELVALCKNRQIDAVFYCNEDNASELPELPCAVLKDV